MDNFGTTGSRPEWEALKSIVLIGNHLPRQCGIATFTTHLLESIALNAPDKACWAVAMNDRPTGYSYPSQVRFEINQSQLNEYSLAADLCNLNQVDVICLQHEYGIFGGKRGSFIIELLRNLNMPVVTTLHTILKDPNLQDRHIMMQLAEFSDRLVVMSERSVEFLRDIYQVPEEKIVLIHHGIPDVPFVKSDAYKDKFGVSGKKVILTFGLLSPGKGIEVVIDALPEIVKAHPQVIYMVVGATHPHLKMEDGEDYRNSLHRRAKELGVSEHIVFHDRFVADEDLLEFIGVADIYVTPYLNEAQIISGTLAYALGMGKAVISTPFWHAQELLADDRGRLVPFRDQAALAREVIDLLDHPDECRAIQERAYQYGRKMVWSDVGRRYLDTFAEAKRQRLRKNVPRRGLETLGLRQQRLPEIKLDYLRRMTDDTGMLQHAKYTVADRTHGYCVDDNARALIVAVTLQDLQPLDSAQSGLAATYLSFLGHAFNDQTGRFRNFMSYDRYWLEGTGSEDSHGRAVWGLGVAVALGRDKGQVGFSVDLFHRALDATEHFTHPRAIAFAIIGIHAYLGRYSGDSRAKMMRKILSERLMQRFRDFAPQEVPLGCASEDWPWCDNILTYDNARLPQALLLSGQWLPDSEMLEMGLRSLDWLKQVQTDEKGRHFVAIGNHGWFPRGGEKARFDQQPIEAAAMVDACIEAFNCTRDEEWITYAYRCLNWYQGENDLGVPLCDYATGGCRDGLEAQGANENQGAESTLCWLMALLAVYNHRSWDRVTPEEEPTRLDVQKVSSE
ncbi:MAG TPA: glycosyltransferase [Gammaproteobacteria bacterium]|nr:GDP-mannose-dependent alpha-(1-6)-phosphatidylinositol monomannoside mannosyltransferase [bacterium BMS3Abin11]HDH15401.1 glycosyltransferase [Gammaproteobacteria bacterium]